MIRNENEYREAVTRLDAEQKRIEAKKIELEKMGLSSAEVNARSTPFSLFTFSFKRRSKATSGSSAGSSTRSGI